MRKYLSEFIGTCLLVIFGCGSAVAANTLLSNAGHSIPLAYSTLLIAFAFGLVLASCVYIFGNVSGCHINPAVSFGLWIEQRMPTKEFIFYLVSQFLGGILGALILWVMFNSNASLGANGFATLSALNIAMSRAILVEIILTFVFVLAVLSITANTENKKIAGLMIGLSLTLVHILGIPFTGTSVNPARSFGPALVQGGTALNQVWVFILAPLVGAALAGITHKFLIQPKKEATKAKEEIKKETKPEVKKVVKEEKPKSTTTKKTASKTTKKKTTK